MYFTYVLILAYKIISRFKCCSVFVMDMWSCWFTYLWEISFKIRFSADGFCLKFSKIIQSCCWKKITQNKLNNNKVPMINKSVNFQWSLYIGISWFKWHKTATHWIFAAKNYDVIYTLNNWGGFKIKVRWPDLILIFDFIYFS